MQRQSLKQQDLLALLNWELAAYDECAGCHFISIRPMAVRDDIGANWFDARVHANRRLGVEEHFIVRHVVEQTRRQFDLATH